MSASTLDNPGPELVYINSMLAKTTQNRGLALALFKKLFQELPSQIQQIDEYLSAQDYKHALIIIHKLHGSMSFCGFTELQKLCNCLETSLLQQDLTQTTPLFLQIKQKATEFETLQNKIFNALQPLA